MGFPGRLEAIRAPTIGKGRKGNMAHNGVLMPRYPTYWEAERAG